MRGRPNTESSKAARLRLTKAASLGDDRRSIAQPSPGVQCESVRRDGRGRTGLVGSRESRVHSSEKFSTIAGTSVLARGTRTGPPLKALPRVAALRTPPTPSQAQ